MSDQPSEQNQPENWPANRAEYQRLDLTDWRKKTAARLAALIAAEKLIQEREAREKALASLPEGK